MSSGRRPRPAQAHSVPGRPRADDAVVLACDVGATNTRVAVFDPGAGPRRPRAERRYLSSEHPDCESIIGTFLDETSATVAAACIGVPGPVLEGRAEITNLDWVIDATSLARSLDLDGNLRVVNDLLATATAIPQLNDDEVSTINQGDPVQHAPLGVIAPGTGLGEAFLLWDGTEYRAHPSEGGHASFAPRTEIEIELLRHMLQRYDHVSYERVCSGRAMPETFEFFRERHDAVDPVHHAAILGADDPTPLIVDAALSVPADPVCRRTVETFVSVLGAETGNLALKILAAGGMYLAGGLSPRLLPLIDSPGFRSSYAHKGRFGDMVERFPVHVVLQPDTGLIGAAALALSLLAESPSTGPSKRGGVRG